MLDNVNIKLNNLTKDEKVLVLKRILQACDRGIQHILLRTFKVKGRSKIHSDLGSLYYLSSYWSPSELNDSADEKNELYDRLETSFNYIVDNYKLEDFVSGFLQYYSVSKLYRILSIINIEMNVDINLVSYSNINKDELEM